jgi:hypothetical protein
MTSGDENGPPKPDSTSPPLTGEISIQVAVSEPEPRARQSARVPVEFAAGLRPRGGSAPVSVNILDLSVHGFRIDSHLDLAVGMDVWLRLPGLEPSHARVAWTEGYVAGCKFERALHPAVLDMILSRMKG